jgi:MFS family permease
MVPRDVTTFDASKDRPSQHSLRGLDWLNFLLAGALGGFGPLVAVYLAGRHWTQGEIGLILTASGVAGILSQVPGGELLDRVRSKRFVVALGVAMILISAGILTLWPSFPLVFTAEVVQGTTGGFLGSAVSAISLGLVGHAALPERLGRNQRFAAIGGFTASDPLRSRSDPRSRHSFCSCLWCSCRRPSRATHKDLARHRLLKLFSANLR